jgi:hypothetical protein
MAIILPVVPGVVKFELLQAKAADEKITTRLYWNYSGGAPTNADCLSFAETVSAAYAGQLAGLLSTTGFLGSVTCTDLSSLSGGYGDYINTVVGTRSGTDNPIEICALVNHQIARRYRGGKPRSYFPFGLDGDRASTTNWGPSFVSAVTAGFAGFVAAVEGASAGGITLGTPVNVSYYQGYNPPAIAPSNRAKNILKPRATPVVDVITGSSCNPTFGSQRRRVRAST